MVTSSSAANVKTLVVGTNTTGTGGGIYSVDLKSSLSTGVDCNFTSRNSTSAPGVYSGAAGAVSLSVGGREWCVDLVAGLGVVVASVLI